MKKQLFLVCLVILCLISPVKGQYVTRITWSDEIQNGQVFTWVHEVYKLDGVSVTEPVNPSVNIIEGTRLTINILGDLSKITYSDIFYGLEDQFDYFEMLISGVSYQGFDFLDNVAFFIVPNFRQYYEFTERENIFLTGTFTFDGQKGETDIYDRYTLEYELENEKIYAIWDISTGLLNEYYNYEYYPETDSTREVRVYREMSVFDEYQREIIYGSGILSLILIFITIWILQRKRKTVSVDGS